MKKLKDKTRKQKNGQIKKCNYIEYDGTNADEIIRSLGGRVENGRLLIGAHNYEVLEGEMAIQDEEDGNVWVGHPSMFNKFIEEVV